MAGDLCLHVVEVMILCEKNMILIVRNKDVNSVFFSHFKADHESQAKHRLSICVLKSADLFGRPVQPRGATAHPQSEWTA